MSKRVAELPIIAFPTAEAFRRWLASQPEASPGVRLKLARKASGVPTVSHKEAIDVALCHGWIDGQAEKFDADYWLLRFTPRRPGSKWSQVNRVRALELIEEGRMASRGLREIERAKADGRWDAAYPPQSKASVPDDLCDALKRNRAAQALFLELDARNRYAILYRIHDAKRPETRAARIEKFVAMLGRGETLYPRSKA